MNTHSESTANNPEQLVDEQTAYRLAEEHNLPPIEVDAALHGVPLQTAKGVLKWVDEEEHRLTRAHGLIRGRRLYRPVKMLRNWSRKHRTGRRTANADTSCITEGQRR